MLLSLNQSFSIAILALDEWKGRGFVWLPQWRQIYQFVRIPSGKNATQNNSFCTVPHGTKPNRESWNAAFPAIFLHTQTHLPYTHLMCQRFNTLGPTTGTNVAYKTNYKLLLMLCACVSEWASECLSEPVICVFVVSNSTKRTFSKCILLKFDTSVLHAIKFSDFLMYCKWAE